MENLQRAREQTSEQFDEIFFESTATLRAELENLKTIVSRFSDFAKMPPPEFESVDVNESIRGVVKLFEPQLSAVGRPPITPELYLDEKIARPQADPILLRRALENLVLNSLDAMPAGGTLTVRTSQRNGSVRMEVSDTGAGLTPEECARLFTPYYTTQAPRHRPGPRDCAVGGQRSRRKNRRGIRARRGRDVSHRVARRAPQPSSRSPRRRAPAGRSAAPVQPGTQIMTALKPHLLLIDDDPNTLASLSRAFRLAGYEATVCDSAARALELIRADRFDLIFSDVVMPGKDGISLLEDLKAMGVTTPVVMISGQASVETAVRATRLGAVDFLEKPLSTEKLLVTIENVLRLRHLEDENRDLRRRLGKHEVIWAGPVMERLLAQVERVAASESRVAIHGRNRHGQGTHRANHPSEKRAPRGPFRDAELRRRPRRADRIRIVRPRKRLLHRRGRAPHRQIRAGRGRHALPG